MAKTDTCLRHTFVAGLVLWIFYFIFVISYIEIWGETSRDVYSVLGQSWSGPSQNTSLQLRRSIYSQTTHETIPNYPDMEVINKLFNATELSNLGQNGEAVVLKKYRFPPSEREKIKKAKKEHGFNEYLSNLLPLNRKLPNINSKSCNNVHYKFDLPKASVVICFMNESWSALLRTVHSVINTSPQHLLEEIILVDDFSDKEYLKSRLDNYVSKLRNVTVIRTKRREGLIRARLIGFRAARAPVVIFLDSHCECFPGWFEPIVGRIAENETNVPTPVIQSINEDTFSVNTNGAAHVGIIVFPNLSFDWIKIPEREKRRLKSSSDPIRSPAMAGGLFAVSKRFFERIGTYDPDLETWGGENTELSLKTWMCGGAIEILPCSRVGHIFRKHPNYKSASSSNTYLIRNIARVANVWLDSYKKYVPNIDGRISDFGDVSERIKLRKNLKCHSFQWYIDNVFPEMYFPNKGVFTGEIRSRSQPDKCVVWENTKYKKILKLMSCDRKHVSWDFTDLDEIRCGGNDCWDVGYIKLKGQVVLTSCHQGRGHQEWRYVDGMLKSNSKCLSIFNSKLHMKKCLGKKTQKWLWNKHRTQRHV